MIKEVAAAGKKIYDTLVKAEDEMWDFNEVVNELQTHVKVHGVTFPTLMLIEIIDKFVEDKPNRENRTPDERHVQEGFDRVSAKWMGKAN
tara:strand:- start:133 stop:402 length:270 start_codon:yes stop_codon:yes gene_type:complete